MYKGESNLLRKLGVVNCLKGKKGVQCQIKKLIRVVTCKMCLFSLYFMKYILLLHEMYIIGD